VVFIMMLITPPIGGAWFIWCCWIFCEWMEVHKWETLQCVPKWR
jgi:hypothetical protein